MAEELQFLDYEGLSTFKGRLNNVDIVTTGGTGAAYTATIPGVTELKVGMSFIIIPHEVSTTVNPSLNVNGLGTKYIKRRLSGSYSSTVAGSEKNWIKNKPIRVTYDGLWWVVDDVKPKSDDLYGTVPITNGGTGSTSALGARIKLDAQQQHTTITLTLLSSGWAEKSQTVSVTGVTAFNTVICGANPSCHAKYAEYGIYASAQGDGTLTFSCDSVPSSDLQANVIILNVN